MKPITDFKQPSTNRDLRQFLGMLNFYRRCIPQAARHQAPLNAFLKGFEKNYKRLVPWTPETVDAFEKYKQQLTAATLLAHWPS